MSKFVSPRLIEGVYRHVLPHLTPKEVDALGSLGISSDTLARDPIVKAGWVDFDEDCFTIEHNLRFQTVHKRVLAKLARVTAGNACDIVGWDSRTGRVATYCREAWAVGAEIVLRPRLHEEPLPIWSDPLSYLRGGRTGILPLRLSALPYQLEGVRDVVVEDAVFGQRIQSEYRRFVPRIWVCSVEVAG